MGVAAHPLVANNRIVAGRSSGTTRQVRLSFFSFFFSFLWGGIDQTPVPPQSSIFKLTAAYKVDPYPKKVNLGVGAYRDDNSKPWVLPVVKKVRRLLLPSRVLVGADLRARCFFPSSQATAKLLNDDTLDHEYLPILGLPEYTAAAAKLILGTNSPAIQEGRAVSVQTISGTGANHLGALLLSRFYHWNGPARIYLSNPTWGAFLMCAYCVPNRRTNDLR